LENGIIINDPSFLPFFPIFQNILCPGLGAAKLKSLVEDCLDQGLANILFNGQGWILPGSWKLDSPSKKGSKRKLITLTDIFSCYLGVPR
jgi:membrane-associated PAP2 superfamily phosphatase